MLTLSPPLRARLARTALRRAFAAAGLNPVERHVLRERARERSHGAISRDRPMLRPDGTPYTRQRVKQLEQRALAKLGLPRGFSVAGIHDEDRVGRAAELQERGRRVAHAELHHDPETVGPRRKRTTPAEDAAARMTALADQFIREVQDAG